MFIEIFIFINILLIKVWIQEAPRNTCRPAGFTAEEKTFKFAHWIQEKK